MKTYGEQRYSSTILNLGTKWWPASHPGHFVPGERARGTHWIGGLVVPDAVWTPCSGEKSVAPAGNRTPAVQRVDHHYTD
jgi:hypothetical protein